MCDDKDDLDAWDVDGPDLAAAKKGHLSQDEPDLEPDPDDEAFDLENDEAEPEPGDFWFETDDFDDD